MLLAAELHARQLQGAVEPQRAFQPTSLGKALLEVHVRHPAQGAVELQALPFLNQLFAIVIAPTDPAFQARVMLAEPAFERRPDLAQRLRGIDVGLGDAGQFPAKRRQQGPTQRPDETLE